MWILIAALPIGLFLGLMAGGNFNHVREIELKVWYLLVPAFAAVALMAVDRDPPGEWILLPFALVLFAVFAFRNIAIVGMSVVGVGIIANLVPVLLNGDMPVSEKAVIQAGLADESNIDLVQLGAGRRFEESGDLLTPLGAIVPLEPVSEVVTFGDLIVIAGLINVGFRAIRPTMTRREEEAPAPVEPLMAASLADAIGGPQSHAVVASPSREAGPIDPTEEPDEPQSTQPQSGSTPAPATTARIDSVADLTAPIDLDELPTFVQGSATWGD